MEAFDTAFGLNVALDELITDMREAKPGDRSEIDRAYAVSITMLEQAEAYFRGYVLYKLRQELESE